jgi:hypothetical protein
MFFCFSLVSSRFPLISCPLSLQTGKEKDKNNSEMARLFLLAMCSDLSLKSDFPLKLPLHPFSSLSLCTEPTNPLNITLLNFVGYQINPPMVTLLS